MLRLNGWRGFSPERCPTCPSGSKHMPSIRCDDCTGGAVVCEQCCIDAHRDNPFHRIKVSLSSSYRAPAANAVSQRWNGRFFEQTTLQAIGLTVQLGHQPGHRCRLPVLTPRSFVVIHTNGFHPVTLLFCGCDEMHAAGTRVQQLLRYELYPATLEDPTTCATFRLMENFHLLTLQSKVTVYNYYMTLQKLTDRMGLGKPVVSFFTCPGLVQHV